MRVLFDHNLPRPLRLLIPGHLVLTAKQKGWDLLENGNLLRAAQADFDVFVTADSDFDAHAADPERQIAIIRLSTNHWPSLRDAHESILKAVEASVPGSFVSIQIPSGPKQRRSHD